MIPSILILTMLHFDGGSLLYPTSNGGQGTLILGDFCHKNIPYMYLWYPVSDVYIERNIFIDSGGISVGTSDVTVYIRNNVFSNQNSYAVEDWASYDPSQTIVEYNSFLIPNRDALLLRIGNSSTAMVGINNWWGTTDESIIQAMIYDRNDDLNCASYIEYLPFLTTPHPDTPVFDFNQIPGANAGPDQIVFDAIALDGSLSNDPDGEIVSYIWQMFCRDNPVFIYTVSGQTPKVSKPQKGFL